MTKQLKKPTLLGKGLDVGTAFIYCAEKRGDSTIFRAQRDAFFDVEQSDFTKRMLESSKVEYIEKGNKLYVVGEDAIKFANVFHRNTRRPLSRGVISPAEEDALPMVELIINQVVGQPRYKGEVVYYSVPGAPVDADFDIVYHEDIVRGFLERRGYTPKPINEGLAVIFSELTKENFTGLGISFGGGMANVCFASLSVPVFSFSVARAGDWIDEQVARVTNETASRITAIKETGFDLSKTRRLTKIERALGIYHNHLIDYVLEHIKAEIERGGRTPLLEKPLTIVLAGGTAMPKGFTEHFKESLKRVSFPLEVGEVRIASQPLYSVAKGALIAAIADEKA